MILRNISFFSVLILFSFYSSAVLGQGEKVISSDSSYILIQNNAIVVLDHDFETKLPFAIVFPMFNKKRVYVTDLSQINLIGKIKDPENVRKLYLNDQKLSFSYLFLFFKVIDVSPGKNILHMKLVPKSGKTLIVNFFIQRPGKGS